MPRCGMSPAMNRGRPAVSISFTGERIRPQPEVKAKWRRWKPGDTIPVDQARDREHRAPFRVDRVAIDVRIAAVVELVAALDPLTGRLRGVDRQEAQRVDRGGRGRDRGLGDAAGGVAGRVGDLHPLQVEPVPGRGDRPLDVAPLVLVPRAGQGEVVVQAGARRRRGTADDGGQHDERRPGGAVGPAVDLAAAQRAVHGREIRACPPPSTASRPRSAGSSRWPR